MFKEKSQEELLKAKKKSIRLKNERFRLSQLEKRQEILISELAAVKTQIEEQKQKIIDIKLG